MSILELIGLGLLIASTAVNHISKTRKIDEAIDKAVEKRFEEQYGSHEEIIDDEEDES